MDAVKTIGDLVIQDSDIIRALNRGLSDTNQRIERHYDEFKLFKNEMLIRSVKIEEQVKAMKHLMIGGFMVMFATMSYMISRLDRLSIK